MMSAEIYAKYWAENYKQDLTQNIMPFWLKNGLDKEFGGIYTCLTRNGHLMDTTKSVWFQGRFAFICAFAYNNVEKRPEWLEAAKATLDFIEEHCFDTDGRMFFEVAADGTPLRKRRYVFSESFAAIAMAEYALATGDAEYARKALDLFKRMRHFLRTPGILKPCYKLQESMMNFVRGALSDADVLLYVTDTVERDDERAAEIIDRIRQSGVPTLVVVNKIDLTTQEALEALVEKWRATLPDAEIIPISAREGFNIAGLFDRILALLPEGEPFYPKDTLTDKTLRFFASEIIREKILRNYDKEIPYSCEIEIEEYREEPGIDRISAVIYVARNSQKGILIGHKGEKLKKVGRQAREELEEFLRKKVFLQLFVKVSEDWRNDQRQLRRFGYDPQ